MLSFHKYVSMQIRVLKGRNVFIHCYVCITHEIDLSLFHSSKRCQLMNLCISLVGPIYWSEYTVMFSCVLSNVHPQKSSWLNLSLRWIRDAIFQFCQEWAQLVEFIKYYAMILSILNSDLCTEPLAQYVVYDYSGFKCVHIWFNFRYIDYKNYFKNIS